MSDRLFRANHERRLLTTFRYVDELVSQAVSRLDAGATESSLSEFVADAKPVQQKVAADYLDRLRGLMRRFLESHRIPPPERSTSTLWAARTACLYASVSVEELRGRHMRGYGDLLPAADRELEVLVAGLSDLLRRLNEYLAQTPDRDLVARIDKLEQPSESATLLRELDRIATAHGLLEFRGSLEMLVERMESQSFEIALFGRVSSGKSSLLNYLLGTDVLPVGVTPVTAVPIRIVYGTVPRAVINFAEAKPIVVQPSHLALYAAEEHNPSNAKHVSRIQVELSAPWLSQGVTFVDTPGLGSLALSGAKETAAYVPRCDASIVLIDASSSLAPDDVVLLDTLSRCGASVAALVTKADLLELNDRERAVDYVRREIQRNLGIEVAVYPISVKVGHTALCDRWIDETLTPQLREHRTLREQSICKKIDGLRSAMRNALELRRSLRSSGRADQSDDWRRLDEELSKALEALDVARFNAAESTVDSLAASALDDAAHRIVNSWPGSGGVSACVGESLTAVANRMGAATTDELRKLHQRLASILAAADEITGSASQGTDWLPRVAGLPIPVFPAEKLDAPVHRPLARFLGERAEILAVRRQLEQYALSPSIEMLTRYGRQLEEWRQRSIGELRGAFNVQADLYRARVQPSLASGRGLGNGDDRAIEHDLSVLDA